MTPNRRRLPLRHAVAAAAIAFGVAVLVVVTREPEPSDNTARTAPAASRPVAATTVSAAPGMGGATAGVTPPADEAAGEAGREAIGEAPGEAMRAVRRVSGPGISPLPESETPPQRVAPPVRPKPPDPPVVMRRLGLVKMETTAEFSVGEIRVRLPGVAVLAPDEICRDRAGVEWPCGRRALAGVRAAVRGRAVDCPLPDKVRRGSFVTDCTAGGADLAERLVASGWARALDREGRLGEAERQAEAKGLGLAGAALPVAADPFPDPGEVPADTTTAPLGAIAGARPAESATGEASR